MNLEAWTADAWIQFAKDHWVILAVAIVAIFIILKLVKTVLKWVLAAAILFGVVVYGGYNIEDLQALGNEVTDTLKNEAIAAMVGEATDATYTLHEDGSYTVETANLVLTGVPNSGEVDVKYHGVSLGTWKMEGAVRDLVVKAREAAR